MVVSYLLDDGNWNQVLCMNSNAVNYLSIPLAPKNKIELTLQLKWTHLLLRLTSIIFWISCLCVMCIHMCIHIHVYVGISVCMVGCTCMCVQECGGLKWTLDIFPDLCPLCYQSRVSYLNPGFHHPTSLASQLALGFPGIAFRVQVF